MMMRLIRGGVTGVLATGAMTTVIAAHEVYGVCLSAPAE